MEPSSKPSRRPPGRWGVGPWLGLLAAAYFVPAVAVHAVWHPALAIRCCPRAVQLAVGAGLVLVGAAVYVGGLVQLARARRAGRLATTGLYALSRHPLYVVQIVLTVPGVVLLIGSWALVPLPAVMGVGLCALVGREQRGLRGQFGPAYDAYRRRVGLFGPRLLRRRRGR